MHSRFRAVVCGSLIAFMALAGCGRSALPPTAPVSGSVTLNGKLLTTGLVCFVPDNSKGTFGRMSVATIQADGRFENATCFNPDDGALVGFHKVVIDVRNILPEPIQPGLPSGAPAQPRSLVPKRYASPDTSELTAEVKAGVKNTFEFKLE